MASARPTGQADQEAEIIPAAGVGIGVDADIVREPRNDESERRDGPVEQAVKEPARAGIAGWLLGASGEEEDGEDPDDVAGFHASNLLA